MKRSLFTYHLILGIFIGLMAPLGAKGFAISADTSNASVFKAELLSTLEENDKPFMSREFTLSGPGILKVSTLSGDIKVERTSDSSNVRVELYVDRGYAFWSNTKNLENYRITMLQRGNEIIASVEQKSKETGFFSDQMKFSYKIFVPESMSTEMSTSAGDISISGMTGQHMVKTGVGNVNVQNINGKLGAYSASGNIEISSSSGTLYAQSEAGKLSISKSQGEIRLKTNAGDINAHRISGSLLAQTSSGDITADFQKVSTGISLDANYGDIDLTIPRNEGYNITLSGSEVEFSGRELFSGSASNSAVQGTLRGGGVTVKLITKSGDVTLDLEN